MNHSNNLVETKTFNSLIMHSVSNFGRETLSELSNRIISIYRGAKCYVYCSSMDKMYLYNKESGFLIPLYNTGGADPMKDPSYIKLNKPFTQITHEERMYRSDHEAH